MCTGPGIVRVLDSATGEVVGRCGHRDGDGHINSLAYVDHGRSLLVGHSEGPTYVLDAETLLPRGEPFDVPASCCATPIGHGSTAMVYEGSGDGASVHWRVIDVNTGEVLVRGRPGPVSAYTSIASPDGSTVAVAGDTGEIVTIDVSTGDEQRRSTGLGAEVWWLNYSDDGELLVSGANDGGVSLWDATTLEPAGHRLPTAPRGAGPGWRAVHRRHPRRGDRVVRRPVYRWDTGLDQALDFACQMAGRTLTEAEWAQFLPAQPYRNVCPGLEGEVSG